MEYVAISYCWGTHSSTDRIWLTETSYLPINSSAARILHSVKPDLNIWIDSVCINQEDTKEKSKQVSLMWDIYRAASKVAILLGEDEEGADLAMELIMDTTDLPWTFANNRDYVWIPNPHVSANPRFDYKPESWKALTRLLERPWFGRVWVMQEVVAAGADVRLIYGGYDIPWKNLVDLVEKLQHCNAFHLIEMKDSTLPCQIPTRPRGVESVLRITHLKSTLQHRPGGLPMQDNLVNTAGAEASNSRDHIFALRSMSQEAHLPQLQPRYDKSVCEIFTDITGALLALNEDPLLLHMAGIGWERVTIDLPSWVPDYVTGRFSILISHGMFAAATGYLSRVHALVLWKQSDATRLQLQGTMIERVKTVCPGLPKGVSILRSLVIGTRSERTAILRWFNTINRTILSVPTLAKAYLKPSSRAYTRLDALCQTLTASTDYSEKQFDVFSRFLLCAVACGDEPLRLEELGIDLRENALAFIRILDRFSRWTVFETTGGYLGRGPPGTQQGDHVCVFLGGKTPFLVRKVSSSALGLFPICRLVGDCYVLGLMRNEVTTFSAWRWTLITLI